jgi:hypothetical protein
MAGGWASSNEFGFSRHLWVGTGLSGLGSASLARLTEEH